MGIALIIVAVVAIAAAGLHLYKRMCQVRERRMKQNEYDTAVVIWTFARDLKVQLDEAIREGNGVLSFSSIRVPHGPGYKLTLELAGFDFRVHGLPERAGRSGRLSFYIDRTLTLRAAERNGETATEDDSEYTGDESNDVKKM